MGSAAGGIGTAATNSTFWAANGTAVLDLTHIHGPSIGDFDGPGGLEDIGGNGVYNDLPGGQSLNIRVIMELICTDPEEEGCVSNECLIEQVEINGIRDCDKQFQEFVDLDEPVYFFSIRPEASPGFYMYFEIPSHCPYGGCLLYTSDAAD